MLCHAQAERPGGPANAANGLWEQSGDPSRWKRHENMLLYHHIMDSSVGWFNNVTHKIGEIDQYRPIIIL